jgi:Ricin-type beta-trefoil lectin domain-like
MDFDTKIVSVSSGKVLTVPGSTTQNIPLVLDNDTGAPNQVWRWVSIDDTWSKVVSKASGKLLDAPDPSSGDAPIIILDDGSTLAAVIQCDETGSPNQHWARDVISPCVFKLRVRSSQRYLEAPNYPSGTIPVFQRGPSDRRDQQWHLVMVDLGAEPFKIISRASGKVLEVPKATTDDVPVGQNAETGNPHQQWRLVPVAGGFFKIVSLSSQKVLDAKGSPTNDSQVIQSADTGAPSQQWRVLYAGLGYYKIVSRTTGKVLDVPGSTSDNVPICQWADHGGPNQQWSIAPVPAPAPKPKPPTAPGPGPGQQPGVLTPEAPEYVKSWFNTTNGIQDYVLWQEMFAGRGFDLRLMSLPNDVSRIPTSGKNLIIVAAVNNVLHFRFFDGDGKVVVDTDEKSLSEQAWQIKELGEQLKSLWPPHKLTWSDKERVITAVTSIVGHTPGRKGEGGPPFRRGRIWA